MSLMIARVRLSRLVVRPFASMRVIRVLGATALMRLRYTCVKML